MTFEPEEQRNTHAPFAPSATYTYTHTYTHTNTRTRTRTHTQMTVRAVTCACAGCKARLTHVTRGRTRHAGRSRAALHARRLRNRRHQSPRREKRVRMTPLKSRCQRQSHRKASQVSAAEPQKGVTSVSGRATERRQTDGRNCGPASVACADDEIRSTMITWKSRHMPVDACRHVYIQHAYTNTHIQTHDMHVNRLNRERMPGLDAMHLATETGMQDSVSRLGSTIHRACAHTRTVSYHAYKRTRNKHDWGRGLRELHISTRGLMWRWHLLHARGPSTCPRGTVCTQAAAAQACSFLGGTPRT